MKMSRKFNGERIVFSKNGAILTGYSHEKKMDLDFYFTLYAIINSKWTTDLKVRTKTKTSKMSRRKHWRNSFT